MPRKLNKLPESMSAANDNNKKHLENPATMPASNLEDTVKIEQRPGGPRQKEMIAKTLELNEKNNQIEALRGERATEALREQINTSKEDRTSGKDLVEARKALDLVKAKKDQDKVINKAASFGLSQAQFLQMLDNGPLEENESKSFFGTITNTFRRLAGQPWAGKDAKKLNELMESYRAAERTVDTANAEALENAPSNARPRYRVTDANQMSKGGDSFDAIKKSAADMVNPETYKMTGKVSTELAKLKAEEENPGGTADKLLEKYAVSIGKGRTIAKDGKLEYLNEGTETLSVADLVNDQTLLNVAYNQILEKNKKDAKALVDAIGAIRYENRDSAMASNTEPSRGRGPAIGRKQADVGTSGMKFSGRGAGASSMDNGLSDQLQALDAKKATKEIGKLKDQVGPSEQKISEQQAQLINAKTDYLRLFSRKQAEEVYELLTGKKAGPNEKANIITDVADLFKSMSLESSRLDSQSRDELAEKEIDYNHKLELDAALDRVASYASKIILKSPEEQKEEDFNQAINDSIPALKKAGEDTRRRRGMNLEEALAESIPAAAQAGERMRRDRAGMTEVSTAGRNKMETIAAQDRAKASANEDADTYAKPKAKAPKLAKGLSTKKRAG